MRNDQSERADGVIVQRCWLFLKKGLEGEGRSDQLWESLQQMVGLPRQKPHYCPPNHIIKRGKALTGCADSLVCAAFVTLMYVCIVCACMCPNSGTFLRMPGLQRRRIR
jgi:hypothetical protein